MKIWRFSKESDMLLKERECFSQKWIGELEGHVNNIIGEVKKYGDAALAEFSRKYDGINVSEFRVEKEKVKKAYRDVTKEQIYALRFSKKRIEEFQRVMLNKLKFTWRDSKGVSIRNIVTPIENVGCYVPGGYSSSLLMTVIPAKVANVPRVVVCSPPRKDGNVDPVVLAAADICDVDEVFSIGGAHAIAALAYGTKSLRPVNKIVGAGNKYVTTAKVLLSRYVSIDMPAGPSEIIILADNTADPKLIALDLVSQAEHSSESICGLVTTSKDLAEKVSAELKGVQKNATEILDDNGFAVVCNKIDEAIDFVNSFAPEHLELMVDEEEKVIERIRSAGMIFLGPYSPVSAGDYCTGSNHIIPTGGAAKVYSNLSVVDFVKRISLVHCSKDGLHNLTKTTGILANSERMPNHARAVEGRFEK